MNSVTAIVMAVYLVASVAIVIAAVVISLRAEGQPNRYWVERLLPLPAVVLVGVVTFHRFVQPVGGLARAISFWAFAYFGLVIAVQVYYDGIGPWEGVV